MFSIFPFILRTKKNQRCQLLLIHKIKITEGEWRGMYFLYVYFNKRYFKKLQKIICNGIEFLSNAPLQDILEEMSWLT